LPSRRLGTLALAGALVLIPSFPIQAAPKHHEVREGDSLWTIARRYGVSVGALERENRLADASKLSLGQRLRIPDSAEKPSAAPALRERQAAHAPRVARGSYRVRPGDSLWTISRQFGTTPARLAADNGIKETDTLRLDQELRVPAANASAASAAAPQTSQAAARSVPSRAASAERAPTDTVRVRAGDTLWSLSRRHGTTPARLASLNGIRETATLRLDQVLKVPAAAKYRPASDAATVAAAPVSKRADRRVAAATSRGGLLVAAARRFLGTPYRWGGTGRGGFDCSGFIYAMYDRMGIRLPRTSFAMFGVGRSVPRSELRPGDLVFFTTYARGASHAGIYVGGNTFVHASSAGRGVRINSLGDAYYNGRYLGARRHL
jgi:peptidoglycan endopeptidase LytE